MATLDMAPDALEVLKAELDDFFYSGTVVYCGYVDDHRNTDNAWLETTCVNFHDETGFATR